jgi:hypothetical protein
VDSDFIVQHTIDKEDEAASQHQDHHHHHHHNENQYGIPSMQASREEAESSSDSDDPFELKQPQEGPLYPIVSTGANPVSMEFLMKSNGVDALTSKLRKAHSMLVLDCRLEKDAKAQRKADQAARKDAIAASTLWKQRTKNHKGGV